MPHVVGSDDALRAAIAGEQSLAQLVARYGFHADAPALLSAYCVWPDNGNVRYWMSRKFAEHVPTGLCPPR